MNITVTFPGAKRVDARFGAHVVRTDQPVAQGGGDTGPDPFSLFLASVATCAGFYVQAFCATRGISTRDIKLTQEVAYDENQRLAEIAIDIELPAGFPDRYVEAIKTAALSCKVKKVLTFPPSVVVRVKPSASDVIAAQRGEEVVVDRR
jgi:putative redox protein